MVNSSRRISVPYFQVCRPRTQVRFSDSVYEFCNSLEGKKVGLPSVATSEKVSCGRPPIPGENGTPGKFMLGSADTLVLAFSCNRCALTRLYPRRNSLMSSGRKMWVQLVAKLR